MKISWSTVPWNYPTPYPHSQRQHGSISTLYAQLWSQFMDHFAQLRFHRVKDGISQCIRKTISAMSRLGKYCNLGNFRVKKYSCILMPMIKNFHSLRQSYSSSITYCIGQKYFVFNFRSLWQQRKFFTTKISQTTVTICLCIADLVWCNSLSNLSSQN